MKQIKSFRLMLLGLMAMGGMNAYAQTVDEAARSVEGIVYKLETLADKSKVATVIGANQTSADTKFATIVIPATVVGDEGTYKVTAFAVDWETAKKDISAITTSLTINVDNLTADLDGTQFDGFTKLETLAIADATEASKAKVKTMPAGLAASKATIASVTLSGNMTTIAKDAFWECAKLESIDLKNVETVGQGAFGFSGLKSVTLDKVKNIGPAAFAYTPLETLTLPAGLETIDVDAFKGTQLTSLVINIDNDVLTTVPANTFAGIATLESVKVKSTKITKIDVDAFKDCTALTQIDLSEATALTDIGTNSLNCAFPAANAYTSVKLAGTAMTDLPIGLANSKASLAEITFPAGLTVIGADWFNGFTALTSVTLPEELLTIGDRAFMGSGLTSLTLPEKVTGIGNHAFYACADLASVDLSAATAINTIGVAAFSETAITEINIPASVTTLGSHAFENCAELATVSGMEGVTTLEEYLFNGCTKLASIAISEEVTFVGPYSLAGTIIEELNVPKAEIKKDALGVNDETRPENTTLKKVVMGPYGISSWGFANCTALESFTWNNPNVSGTYISSKVFWNCTALKKFIYKLDKDLAVADIAVSPDAFLGCQQYVEFWTSKNYAEFNDPAPLNTKYMCTDVADYEEIKTVKDKTGEKYFQKFINPLTSGVYYEINPEDVAGVYSIYVDEGKAYFQSLKKSGGKYIVREGECVVIKTDAEATVKAEAKKGYGTQSVLIDNVMCLGDGTDSYSVTLAKFQYNSGIQYISNYESWMYYKDDITKVKYPDNSLFLYRLTNTASNGFGFTKFTGSELKGGQFFIISDFDAAAGRLQNVWLDEDGNVEDEATAIKSIENATENSAIYNLQGIRVQNAKKGLYIQNGKKYVVK